MEQDNKKFIQLVKDYKITFGSDEGKRILDDLKKDPISIIQRTLKATVTRALFTKVNDL